MMASAAPSATAAPDAIAAQHVLVAYKGAKDAPKTVSRAKADAQKRAEEVATKAKAGGDFSALVAEYSDDPAAKERQGSLGKFTRDKMVKPFSDAAFALPIGGVTAPVETPYGFHVIKRNQ
jgi:peptidyl-prolyl cis-trans isomerase NIMA-interacting 1